MHELLHGACTLYGNFQDLFSCLTQHVLLIGTHNVLSNVTARAAHASVESDDIRETADTSYVITS